MCVINEGQNVVCDSNMSRDIVVCATSKTSVQPAHTHSLIRAFCWSLEYSMSVNLLTDHHLEFLSLKAGCIGSAESTLVKMPHCWKLHVMAHIFFE